MSGMPEGNALHDYGSEERFAERLAALTVYQELTERRWRGEQQPGDRQRLRAARLVLEETGGLPARWIDTRERK